MTDAARAALERACVDARRREDRAIGALRAVLGLGALGALVIAVPMGNALEYFRLDSFGWIVAVAVLLPIGLVFATPAAPVAVATLCALVGTLWALVGTLAVLDTFEPTVIAWAALPPVALIAPSIAVARARRRRRAAEARLPAPLPRAVART